MILNVFLLWVSRQLLLKVSRELKSVEKYGDKRLQYLPEKDYQKSLSMRPPLSGLALKLLH